MGSQINYEYKDKRGIEGRYHGLMKGGFVKCSKQTHQELRKRNPPQRTPILPYFLPFRY